MQSKQPKIKPYKESMDMLKPPKGYKKSTTNQPDPKKVQKYFSGKKK